MKLTRVLSRLYTEPWLIRPAMHAAICTIARRHAEGGDAEILQHELAAQFAQPNITSSFAIDNDGVAVINIEGVIMPSASGILNSSGVFSLRDFISTLRELVRNERVKAIILRIDSPGGEATLVEEAASAIRGATQVKPVLAYVDSEASSAAYWLASQADVIYATPSAEVGSIGVYVALLDESRAYEMQGLELKIYRSGIYKALGLPGKKITKEDGEFLQSLVNSLAEKFFRAVREGRSPKVLPDEIFDGRWWPVDTALTYGMIDGVSDFEEVRREALFRAGYVGGIR